MKTGGQGHLPTQANTPPPPLHAGFNGPVGKTIPFSSSSSPSPNVHGGFRPTHLGPNGRRGGLHTEGWGAFIPISYNPR